MCKTTTHIYTYAYIYKKVDGNFCHSFADVGNFAYQSHLPICIRNECICAEYYIKFIYKQYISKAVRIDFGGRSA